MTLPPVIIQGVGAVTPIGRSLTAISQRLAGLLPRELAAPSIQLPAASPGTPGEGHDAGSSKSGDDATDRSLHSRSVDDALLADAALAKRLRRADRFTRMAVIAASDAWERAEPSLNNVPPDRIGLIVSSGFGPHGRSFKFLDGILDCGDDAALPTDFSHSVHGAPAAYITEILNLRGPSLSIADFVTGFEQAVQQAQCWLADGTCDRVLVGAVEELGAVLLHVASRLLNYDQRIAPSEGAVFFVLSREDVPDGVARLTVADKPGAVDLLLIDHPIIGLPTPDPAVFVGSLTWSFSPHFGHNPSSAAFQLLGGLLALRPPLSVDNAATFRPSCDASAATLRLSRIEPSQRSSA